MPIQEDLKPLDTKKFDPRFAEAKRISDELIGTTSRRARSWKLAFFTACIVLVCQTLILASTFQKSRMNVVFVRYDDNLNASPLELKGADNFVPRENQLKKFLRDFIVDFRSRSTDPFVTKQRQKNAFNYVADDARKLFDKTLEEENKYMKVNKIPEFIRNVQPSGIVRASDQSFLAEWQEKSFDSTGNETSSKNFKGIFTYAIYPVTDKMLAEDNPLGLYITVIDISEEKTPF